MNNHADETSKTSETAQATQASETTETLEACQTSKICRAYQTSEIYKHRYCGQAGLLNIEIIMGDLTANFSKSEFACKHCGKLILDPLLPPALQMLRDTANKMYLLYAPIRVKVHCGYRCPAHNKAVGGEPNSQHVLGRAADITLYIGNVAPLSMSQMYLCAMKVPIFVMGGVGIYPEQKFMHVDVRGTLSRWGKVNGAFTTAAFALNYAVEKKV